MTRKYVKKKKVRLFAGVKSYCRSWAHKGMSDLEKIEKAHV